jgi:acetyltransferase-like isoleucine patch superfamily enzyme
VGARAAVGTGARLQTNVVLEEAVVVEADVFLGPGARAGQGAVLRRACRVGAAATIAPRVEVGEDAFIAAGASVAEDVAPRAVMVGRPARRAGEVPDEDLIERWR